MVLPQYNKLYSLLWLCDLYKGIVKRFNALFNGLHPFDIR
jgi:hypothetical protein